MPEFLLTHGYTRSSPTSFTNGQACLHFQGEKFIADPGDGRKAWVSNLADAKTDTLKLLLQTIVCTPPFAIDVDVAQTRAEQTRGQAALQHLVECLRECPEAESGLHLRRFLWSLYNQYHFVNLWELNATLNADQAQAVGVVFTSLLHGILEASELKRALAEAGELQRWNRVPPSDTSLRRLEEAEDAVRHVLRGIPPCQAHTELSNLLQRFESARRALLNWS